MQQFVFAGPCVLRDGNALRTGEPRGARAAACILPEKGALRPVRPPYAGRMTISLMRPVVES